MRLRSKDGKVDLCLAISKRFQGLGFMISFANPIVLHEYLLIEIKFTWFLFWFTYETGTVVKRKIK